MSEEFEEIKDLEIRRDEKILHLKNKKPMHVRGTTKYAQSFLSPTF